MNLAAQNTLTFGGTFDVWRHAIDVEQVLIIQVFTLGNTSSGNRALHSSFPKMEIYSVDSTESREN